MTLRATPAGAVRALAPGLLLAAFLALTLIQAATPAAAGTAGFDFWIQTPTGWTDKRDSLGQDLIKQVVAPDGNAFVEVYAARGSSPGLQRIADGMENAIRGNGGVYLQNRLSSTQRATSDGRDGIAREYSGNNNGIPVRAVVYYTYGNDAAVVVVGVFAEPVAAQYKELVYHSVLSLRFSEPRETSGGLMGGADRCGELVGKWRWFTGSTAEFLPNGQIPGNGHSWACLDPAQGVFRITWSNGQWIDTLRLDTAGNRLEGTNQKGDRVWGERLR